MNSDDKIKDRKRVEFISVGAGAFAMISQYGNLQKEKMKILPRVSVSVLTFLFCYGVTRVALKNIYQLD